MTVPEDTWYKDEGGRDKCINLDVHLLDHADNLVKNHEVRGRRSPLQIARSLDCSRIFSHVDLLQVPLKVALYYHKGEAEPVYVNEQDILKQSQDGQRKIGRDGKTTLKIRIEDVSKNHRTQPFCVKVEPDTVTDPSSFDISGDYSGPVTVKSKRTKRQRRAEEGHVDTGFPSHSGGGMPMQPNMGMPFQGHSNLAEDAALGGVIQWAGMVVSTLQALQFQQIGYECAQAPENAGGAAALAKPQLDMNKPIYRCVTFTSVDGTMSTPPPDAINQLLTTYASETMGHLHNLLKTIEKVKESKAGLEGLGGDDGDRGMKRLAGYRWNFA